MVEESEESVRKLNESDLKILTAVYSPETLIGQPEGSHFIII